MVDDQLPVGPGGENPGLVPHVPRQGDLALRQGTTAIDLFEEPKRNEDEIDLLAYWQILVKRRWLVLGIVASVLAVTLLITLLTPPVYRSTATLQIDRETMQIVLVEGVTSTESANSGDYYQTQYELLKSRALAERVADTMHLAGSPSLDAIAGHSWLNRTLESLRPQAAKTSDKPAAVGSEQQLRSAVSLLQSRLVVEPVSNSRLVRVSFDSGNPQLSASIANAFAQGFIAKQLEHRVDASSYAKKYLEDRLRQTKAKLEKSERDLVAFAQKESIVSTGDGPSLVAQNLTALNSQLAAAQGERIRAEARWKGLQSAGGSGLPADMLVDSLVRDLQQQRAVLQRQYQEKLQVFKPDYPEMKQLKGQIDAINGQIASETANMRSSLRAEYDAAVAQERLLTERLASLRTQTLDVDSRSIDYNILKREADTNRQLYDALLQRYKEIGVATDIGSNTVSIVDSALPGRRYKPNLSWNMMAGLLLGALAGVLAAFGLEFVDQTLKTPQDVEQKLRLSVLGIIPRLKKSEKPLEALRDLRSAFSEAYRSVRTALQFSTDNGVPKVLLVTSASPSEGKSTTAWSLARNFAQLGKRVLLIDGDLRNPSLHQLAQVRSEVGLSNLLAGAANINEAVQETDDPRLKIVLAGPLPPNPAELLAGSKLVSLLTVASESYDLVIIDGPPVLGIADAPILANAAAGTLLVVEAGKTRIPTAQMAVKRLLAARARIVGAILSKYATSHGYGYGDYGAYAYGSGHLLTKDPVT